MPRARHLRRCRWIDPWLLRRFQDTVAPPNGRLATIALRRIGSKTWFSALGGQLPPLAVSGVGVPSGREPLT